MSQISSSPRAQQAKREDDAPMWFQLPTLGLAASPDLNFRRGEHADYPGAHVAPDGEIYFPRHAASAEEITA
jgi:hypothetical protein